MNYFGFEDIKGEPGKGKLLIAGPFLSDPHFSRSVVLICEHTADGTIGFILNHLLPVTLADVTEGLESAMPVALYQGGPVQKETLHILHRVPEVLGGVMVTDGLYWGGSYETLIALVKNDAYKEADIRLFVGYAGWAEGQLEDELKDNAWLIGDASPEIVFEREPHTVWKSAISSLGKNFAYLANTPVDPQMN